MNVLRRISENLAGKVVAAALIKQRAAVLHAVGKVLAEGEAPLKVAWQQVPPLVLRACVLRAGCADDAVSELLTGAWLRHNAPLRAAVAQALLAQGYAVPAAGPATGPPHRLRPADVRSVPHADDPDPDHQHHYFYPAGQALPGTAPDEAVTLMAYLLGWSVLDETDEAPAGPALPGADDPALLVLETQLSQGLLSEAEIAAIPPRESALLVARSRQEALRALQSIIDEHHAGTFQPQAHAAEEVTAQLAGLEELATELADDLTAAADQLRRGELPADLAAATDDLLFLHTQYDAWSILLGSHLGPVTLPPAEGRTVATLHALAAAVREAGDGATVRENALAQLARLARLQHRSSPDFAPLAAVHAQVQALAAEITEAAPGALPASARALRAGTHPLALLLRLVADADALEQLDEQSDAFSALEEALPRALVTALLLRKLVLPIDADAPEATATNPGAAAAPDSPTASVPAAAPAPAEKMPVASETVATADLGEADGLEATAAEDAAAAEDTAVAASDAAADAAVWLPAIQWKLLAEPRLALAWHLTGAAGPVGGLPARLLHALLLAPALQHADGALALALVMDFLSPLPAAGAHPLATRLLEVAATLRPALLAPATGAAGWLAPDCPGLPALGALARLVAGRETDAPLRPELGFSPPTEGAWQVRMTGLRAALAAWEAEARAAQYRQQAGHPATRWWQHLLEPDQAAGQLLGYLQARGPASPRPTVQAAQEALQREAAPVAFELSPGHPALAWLDERRASLLELADRWSYLRTIQPGRGSLSQRDAQDKAFCHKLTTALAPARQELAALWPVADAQLRAALPWAEAALAQLHALLHQPAPDGPEPTPTALLHTPLLPYADLPLDAQGQLPGPASDWLPALRAAATAPEPTWTEAFGAHLGRGQHRATARILALPGAGIGADDEALALLREARADALQHQRQAFAERVGRVREAVEQATRRGWLPAAERTELLLRHARLRQPRDAGELDDYTAPHQELDATEATLGAAEATAGGLTAPGFGPANAAFGLFFPDHLRRLEQELESHPLPELLGRLAQGGTVGGTALTPASADDRAAASAALGAWEELRAERTVRGAQAPAEVELLLAFVGFGQPRLGPLAPGAPGPERADLRTEPVADAARCPVPAYGSAAEGRYRLVFVWRKVAEAGQLLDEAGAGAGEAGPARPVIVFYFNSLTETQRHDLLAAGRARRQTVLVLDRTLLLYLATAGLLHPDRLPLFFQLTLPFAWLTPFPADAPELFVGRQTELDVLLSALRESPKIVLGGPASGKTALLNRVVALHHRPAEGQLALLVNVARLGQPERLLAALEQEIKRLLLSHGVVPAGMGASLTFPKVLRYVRTWLRAQPGRRLLLLLDDAREFIVQDQVQQSRIILAIDELEVETNGQFKAVVACRDWPIPIRREDIVLRLGPLLHPTDAGAAEALLRRPLESLGAVFDDERDVSRILVGTGYVPHLLQGMGAGLLDLLADQPAPAPGERPACRLGPAEVDTMLDGMNATLAAYLQEVLADGPHKHLLLLLLAVPDVAEQYAGAAGAGLRPAELARAGRRYWPIGFVGPAARVEAECVFELESMVEAGLALRSATGRYFLAEAGWARPGSVEEMRAELEAFNATHPVNPDDAHEPKAPAPAPAPGPKVSMFKRLTNGRRSL